MGKKEILNKLASGEITIEEAMRMEAEENAAAASVVSEVTAFKKPGKYKFLVIKVSKDNQKKVNIRLPLALAKLAKSSKFKFGGENGVNNNVLKDIDIDEIIRMAEEEGITKFVDVQSDDGENVEIYIE